MAHEFKAALFELLNSFIKGEIAIDWQVVKNDEEVMEILDEIKNRIMHNYALLEDIAVEDRQQVLGRLAIRHAYLVNTYSAENEQDFYTAAREFEQELKKMLSSGTWFTRAKERYDAYASFEDELSQAPDEAQVSSEQLDFFRPVFLVLDFFAFITLDQIDEESEEADEDDELEEEEECDDEC